MAFEDVLLTLKRIRPPGRIRIKVWIDNDLWRSRDVSFNSLLQEIEEIDRDLCIPLDYRLEPFLPRVTRLLKEEKIPRKNSSRPKHSQKTKKQKSSQSPRSKVKKK